jgi:SAM-dependent methyltransferase
MGAALSLLKRLLEAVAALECRLSSAWADSAHRRLLTVQWMLPPQPINFDHQIDLFHGWRASRNPRWLERGVFSSLALRGGDVLELCCGDGFMARNFYSLRSSRVVAWDLDPAIIAVARRKNAGPNLTFVVADVRTQLPEGRFTNVIWDAGLEYLERAEIAQVVEGLRARLLPGGVFSGHTVVETPGEDKARTQHRHQFKSKEDLLAFLATSFANATVFEAPGEAPRALYFWASDGVVPFSPEWAPACHHRTGPQSAR